MKQNISYQKLPRSFYLDDTVNVAKKLIGKLLVRKIDGETLSAIICETESYTGFSDKACHSYKGKSERTKVMFEEGGKAYVYLIYGMYSCFNITTREEGVPEAVLIRAACPVEGIERMKELRQSKKQIKSLNEKICCPVPDGFVTQWELPGNRTAPSLPKMNFLSARGFLFRKSRLLQQKESTLIMQRRRGTFCIGLSIPKALACPLSGGDKNDSGYIFLLGKI